LYRQWGSKGKEFSLTKSPGANIFHKNTNRSDFMRKNGTPSYISHFAIAAQTLTKFNRLVKAVESAGLEILPSEKLQQGDLPKWVKEFKFAAAVAGKSPVADMTWTDTHIVKDKILPALNKKGKEFACRNTAQVSVTTMRKVNNGKPFHVIDTLVLRQD
jgi:hypothetical protein